MEWIVLAQKRDRSWALVNVVMNRRVPVSFSGITQLQTELERERERERETVNNL